MNPLRSYLPRRVANPLVEGIPSGLERNDTFRGERRPLVLCPDGWKDFLGSVCRQITRALFTCLARAAGCGRWGFQHTDIAPVREGDTLLIRRENMCTALARFFQ